MNVPKSKKSTVSSVDFLGFGRRSHKVSTFSKRFLIEPLLVHEFSCADCNTKPASLEMRKYLLQFVSVSTDIVMTLQLGDAPNILL